MLDRKQLIIFFVTFILLLLVLGFSLWKNELYDALSVDSFGIQEETYNPRIPMGADLTAPDFFVPAAPESERSLRKFHLGVENGDYSLKEIVVEQGDTLLIKLISGGEAYDISFPDLGIYQSVLGGEDKQIGFQALMKGTFTYVCRDYCPKDSVIKGSLIVR